MDSTQANPLGYSTKEALIKLRNDISSVITEHKRNNPVRYDIIRNVISFSSEKVLLSGVAYTITLLYIVCLVLTYFLGESVQAHPCLLWEAAFLLIILIINFLVALNEEYLYRVEITRRAEKVIDHINKAIRNAAWGQQHYPNLCAPFSPCVTLQWTYRDGMIVNLPWSLLVEGDIIVMRPGQDAPGHCKGLKDGEPELQFGQIFQPNSQPKDNCTAPRIRCPHPNKDFKMCETPFLKNLKVSLEEATARPLNVFEKQRYLCTVKIMEGIALPLVVVLVVVTCFFRHVYHLPGVSHWTDIYLLQTVAATLPLLQIVFPVAWVALNCFGLARFKLLSEVRQKYTRPKSHSISEEATDPLIQALSESSLTPAAIRTVGRTFWNILIGKEDMVCRTANIVQVLGSLTALCCVDKKGILSWPNPTAERVYILNDSSVSKDSSADSQGSSDKQAEASTDQPSEGRNMGPNTVVEVLDLTHDQNAPFRVEFDDQRWRSHLARLKPLGLAAILNTCADVPNTSYAHFCCHLTCEAQCSEDLVPVTNRRCLCELSKQIGFTEAGAASYRVRDCLAVFRRLQAESIRRDTRFARSLQMRSRVKVPLPHMLAVLAADPADNLHMLTQGTADIVLDSCVDYWNGRDLTPLSAADRKKMIDFYQRSALTAYCTAFAYKPLNRGVKKDIAGMYLELPADSRQLYEPLSQRWRDAPSNLYHSSDSLLFDDVPQEDVDDAEGYFDLQCNQVFVGMVTMQYQAQSDIVELIERLEKACIRFVHFSKENELRSRVFSEKMGIESGWNCHISLMSEEEEDSIAGSPVSTQSLAANRADSKHHMIVDSNIRSTRAKSQSAPSAINLVHSTVKFEDEVNKQRHSITTHTSVKQPRDSVVSRGDSSASMLSNSSNDSAVEAGRSLSRLTDSTEHSAPVPFDCSNRAKLPRGIENIRPHILGVDNVPLLVSLFTDCTPRTVLRMVCIMQEFREVVAVLASSANCLNVHVLMQADASIAVEPLYPVLCQKLPPYQIPERCVGPIDLARTLNSIPCSLSMARDADISLFSLITMSRHYMASLWNCTQYWLCAACFIALVQVGSLLALLPLALGVGGAAWGACVAAPLLAAALAARPLDAAVTQRPGAAPLAGPLYKMMSFVFWCYACKFLPSVLSILVLYWFTLRSFCEQIAESSGKTACWMVYPVNIGNYTEEYDLTKKSFHGWGDDFYDGFYKVQHITLALITLHLVVISISFIHRQSSIWQKGFWTNRVWCATVVILIVVQCVYSVSLCSVSYVSPDPAARWLPPRQGEAGGAGGAGVAWWLAAPYSASLLLVFVTNELIKWRELKVEARNERRARLNFGTKLGMNSPF